MHKTDETKYFLRKTLCKGEMKTCVVAMRAIDRTIHGVCGRLLGPFSLLLSCSLHKISLHNRDQFGLFSVCSVNERKSVKQCL